MRLGALEVVRVSRTQDLRSITDSDLQPAAQDETALFALVRDLVLARTGSRLVALPDKLDCTVVEIGTDLQVGDTTNRDLLLPEADQLFA